MDENTRYLRTTRAWKEALYKCRNDIPLPESVVQKMNENADDKPQKRYKKSRQPIQSLQQDATEKVQLPVQDRQTEPVVIFQFRQDTHTPYEESTQQVLTNEQIAYEKIPMWCSFFTTLV